MENKFYIVGAGMAGLLAGNLLKRHNPSIFEIQPSLPNNHAAVLRFPSPRIGDSLGIVFRKVNLLKTYLPYKNKVADALAYSDKCSGYFRSDRSIIREAFSEDRWIAPNDLIERMSEGLNISYEYNFQFFNDDNGGEKIDFERPVISTLPMPVLMRALKYPAPEIFNYVNGATIRATIPRCEAYVSLYIPDPYYAFNRISITGDELIVEFAFPKLLGPREDIPTEKRLEKVENASNFHLAEACDVLGIEPKTLTDLEFKSQKFAKIQPIDEALRRNFLQWATDEHNIFSLGRFATWRPGLLLDDLIQDINLIEKWATGDRYSMRFKR